MKQLLLLISFLLISALGINAQYETEFQARATLLRTALVNADFNGGTTGLGYPKVTSTDDEKHYWPKAIALLETNGASDDTANVWIANMRTRSPFHFIYVGTVRLLCGYPTAPSIVTYGKDYVQAAFNRNDNYNFVTNEGTENHINMSRTSGYLYCQFAKENYAVDFPTADSLMNICKQWIMDYSKAVYSNGTGEFNSTQYGAYNIVGWINLYDFAKDSVVKNAAHAVLDYYATELAIHYSWGTLGGAEQRTGKGIDSYNGSQSAEYLAWLWFSESTSNPVQGWVVKEFSQSMHAAVSSYRPPKYLVDLARKNQNTPLWIEGSKGSYLFEEQSFVKQFFFADSTYSLGSMASEYGGYTGSSYAIIAWKLVVDRGSAAFPYTISGNGRCHTTSTKPNGRGLNPYTQYVQYKNCMVMMTKTPSNYRDLYNAVKDSADIVLNACGSGCHEPNFTNTKAWSTRWFNDFKTRFPNGAFEGVADKTPVNYLTPDTTNTNNSYLNLPNVTITTDNKIAVANLGKAWMAVIHFNNTASPTLNSSRYYLIDNAALDNMSGFIIEVENKAVFSTATDFINNIKSRLPVINTSTGSISHITRAGDTLNATYVSSGKFSEPIFDWGFGSKTAKPDMFANPDVKFFQPNWSVLSNAGRIPDFSVNSTVVDLFNDPVGNVWPVFKGAGITLENEVLTIDDGSTLYTVDYTGSEPVFGPATSVRIIQDDLFSIYPVPASNFITIDSKGSGYCTILDLSGKALYSGKLNVGTNVISLSGLAKGYYLVGVMINDKKEFKKIIVQ